MRIHHTPQKLQNTLLPIIQHPLWLSGSMFVYILVFFTDCNLSLEESDLPHILHVSMAATRN